MKTVLTIIVIGILLSCNSQSDPNIALTKVNHNELLTRIVKGDVNLIEIAYKNKEGKALTAQDRTLLNSGKSKREFYENKHDKIVEIRISEAKQQDWIEEIQISESFSKPFVGITDEKLDCTLMDSIIAICHKRDQDVRLNSKSDISQIDQLNQRTLLPYLQQCQWPNDKELITGIWYVIQHSDSAIMSYYYNKFKESENKGLVESKIMALMEDRMLMNHGYPQIYGSQMIHKSVYKIFDPMNVNKRRESVGLGTIEENTRRFGFEFNLQDHLNEIN